MTIPRSGSGRQYGYGATKPKNTGYKGKGTVVPIKPVKQAKKNKNRKHTNDAHYGPKPHGGHETQHVKIDKDGHVSV